MKTVDLYNSVTQRVVTELEAGTPPWTKPWREDKLKGVGLLPSNLATGRLYSGSNVLLLWLAATQHGFSSLQFCTYRQANEMGAKVKKGARATHVIFTKHVMREDTETGEEKAGTVVKTYAVFHHSQLEGVPDKYLEPQMPSDREETHAEAVELRESSGVTTIHGANKAAYYPARDEIVMPNLAVFEGEDAYWGTWCHEGIHATGHKSRLDRVYGKRFGDAGYAFEELVAELGSAFLCARLGIAPSFRSASYIAGWLKVLKGDNRAIFSAASYAGHAADWLWKKAFPEAPAEEYRQAAE